ncbi:wee1-like protein kinase [Phragmites australis]|uniref:wee1-like protein kinase n=1 Tax=Phragmites australis TaxID=29695 RepID=UPI002D7A24EC|nr:wee1-like protein kinase [Phragmites australis]
MLRTKTPRSRGGKARRAPAAAAVKAKAAAEGRSPSGELSLQLENVSLVSFLSDCRGAGPTPFEALLEEESSLDDPTPPPPLLLPPPPEVSPMDADEPMEEKDCCILSQDFFCTPDYITPEMPQLANDFEANKENTPCPKSPEKSMNGRSKRYRRDCSPKGLESTNFSFHQQITPVQFDSLSRDNSEEDQLMQPALQKRGSYVSQSAVALRCRVTPPPCIKNPYLSIDPLINDDVYGGRQCKSSGFSPSIGGDSLSRYRTEFHEIEKIGHGNFSVVFKVLKRIDGCLYAVKRSIKQLHNDRERSQAVKEVQALAALGAHENIVRYFTSWFENEQLYIQMELCDCCLSMNTNPPLNCGEALELLYQICKGLDFIHEHGIAHLDVKPDNIYVRNGVYKLGDFGCATLIDQSLAIEDGDSRYMPPEMLNDKYEHLDKVDIFSLGAAIYELLRGTPLPESGPHFTSIREGKIALLPGCPIQFQSLIKSMMDPDPVKRPSAKEILRHPVIEKLHKAEAKK